MLCQASQLRIITLSTQISLRITAHKRYLVQLLPHRLYRPTMPTSNRNTESPLSRAPSLSLSVDSTKSSSLVTPRGSELVVTPPQSRSKSLFDQPRSGRMSDTSPSLRYSSSPSPLSKRRLDKRSDSDASSICDTSPHPCYSPPSSPLSKRRLYRSNSDASSTRDPNEQPHCSMTGKRYHPYIPREGGPVPPALHYAARSLGVMSPTDMTLAEVSEVCFL